MKLVFMGSPDFAVPALAALLAAGHEIVAVYSQPPRPTGRGHKEHPCPVHAFAIENNLTVRTPENFKDETDQQSFTELAPHMAVVCAYGLILPKVILQTPRLGCVNIHASLLPRWRGAAPIQRAIMAGDNETGITIMQINEGLDTGPMLMSENTPITPQTTASSLHDTLSQLGAQMIVKTLEAIPSPTPQPESGTTYAKKLQKSEGRLDWSRPAPELERMVRALTPWPGVWFEHQGTRIKVSAADIAQAKGIPGTVLDSSLTVACGSGALALKRLQRPGKTAMDVDDFLCGYALPPGEHLS